MGAETTVWTKWALGIAGLAGALGVGMALAGIHSATRSALVLVFLAVVPTIAYAGLLRSFDRFARLLIAFTVNVVVLASTAILMLVEGLWSPTRGLLAVAIISTLCLVAGLAPVRTTLSHIRTGVVATLTSWHRVAERRLTRVAPAESKQTETADAEAPEAEATLAVATSAEE